MVQGAQRITRPGSTQPSAAGLATLAAAGNVKLSIKSMTRSKVIELEYSKANLLVLLSHGAEPDKSPYSHKQIAEWCEMFWNKYFDDDAPSEIEEIMPILAEVETQWDLYLANTFSIDELRNLSFENVKLPINWFIDWAAQANA